MPLSLAPAPASAKPGDRTIVPADTPAVPPVPQTPTGAESPPTLTRADIPRIEAALGARLGDARYDAALDATGDGVINGMDITFALNRPAPTPVDGTPDPKPGPEPTPAQGPTPRSADAMTRAELVQGILRTFGRTVGAGDPDAVYDLSGDGRISGLDLSFALNRAARPAAPSEGADGPRPSIRAITEAYGARAGRPGYASTLDLNGDGVINGMDITRLLNGATDTRA